MGEITSPHPSPIRFETLCSEMVVFGDVAVQGRRCSGTRPRDTELRDTEFKDTEFKDTEFRDTEFRDIELKDGGAQLLTSFR